MPPLWTILGGLLALLLNLQRTVAADDDQGCDLGRDELCAVRAAMGGSLITPQVIPYFEPKGYLHLFYDNIDVGPAQQLDPVRVARQPYIKYNTTEPELLNIPYILIVLDPDASAVHTSQSCALHWMITDVYFDRQSGLMQSGFVSAQYVRPNPPEGPLHHRYVFLLYEQPLLFIPPVFGNQLRGARAHFNLPLFTLDYGLGAPAAGNFLKSFWNGNNISPEVQKELDEIDNPSPTKTENTEGKKQIVLKSHANPYLAAFVGSFLGLVYSASN